MELQEYLMEVQKLIDAGKDVDQAFALADHLRPDHVGEPQSGETEVSKVDFGCLFSDYSAETVIDLDEYE